ncbi:transmembrane and ubiquitin-like domain-containing protein 1 [Megachile rotundata]|uniref:transmembrane and ubiquitin-like domain-containing protein 1 n=1 Tax=Megachile rotundata TaxID=143995 RepID=UPI00061539B9|nr:PREDICTED: transmembrane and ubiquitin-like domain-containing protein 1 [Megachile rotundata]XP_012152882.1 PREDICTED: transmembrane and ubiquitin-like domain-containing protein 1 [Megachile rotundata]XP_012152883.1 PREDICTED: transmembrane and ubiquitin-like domain-containing protein 1 [Megachile rotundata]
MSLIEGVGDEVTNFFIIVVALLVGWLAWCSTSIADQPLIRTVLILQHRTRTRIAELRANQTTSSFSRPPNLEMSEEESVQPVTDDNNDTSQNCPESPVTDTNGRTSPETHRTPETAATEEVLIEAMDSFNNDNATLLQRQTKINTSKKTSISESCTESIEAIPHEAENLSESTANEINIKLKFINDDQKVVTGSLKELLGDFKRRHFQIELDAQKLVRLVFNGRVLQPDSQTLEKCGLYNNCVVHCLVHQPRPNPVPSQTSTLDNSSSIYFNPQSFSDIPTGTGISSVHNEWDLNRLMLSFMTLTLGLAWYSRYHYAQLFSATTTIALYALTAIFAISLVTNFFPHEDNIRNIE